MKRVYKKREPFQISCVDCKTEFNTSSYRTLRCVKCAKGSEYRNNMLNPEWRMKKLIAMAKNRSKDKSLPFNLTLDHIMLLWMDNQGSCAITKTPFDLSSYGDFGQVNPRAPSIDRVNPKNGYTIGNVRLVTYHINVALSEFGLDALLQLAKDLINVQETP